MAQSVSRAPRLAPFGHTENPSVTPGPFRDLFRIDWPVTRKEQEMSATFATDPMFSHVEALLDRFDPPVHAACHVPGCVHHHDDTYADATWVGGVLAA